MVSYIGLCDQLTVRKWAVCCKGCDQLTVAARDQLTVDNSTPGTVFLTDPLFTGATN